MSQPINPVLVKILIVTSILFLITTPVRPGKWAIIITQDVPEYYVVLSCLVYSLYIIAFSLILKTNRLTSATYILAVAILGRITMEVTVPHTKTAIRICSEFSDYNAVTFVAIYIALFATVIPLYIFCRLINFLRQTKI